MATTTATTATTSLVRYHDSASGAEVELSIADIRQSLCPAATEKEAAAFLHLCRYMGLNPFVRDAYLIKYGDGPASMVVGKDAFSKRADAHPQFAGIESGVIVMPGSGGCPVNRKGTLVLDGETLVGGWARVARTDRKLDVDTTVSFKEFSTGRAMWSKMPGIMIEKVAIVKALRTAFPSTFSGLYDQAEMGIDLNDSLEPIQGEAVTPALPASPKPAAPATPAAPVLDDAITDGEVAAPAPPRCGEHDAAYEWRVNPSTQEGRYVHQYHYDTADGTSRKGWCILS